MIPRTIARLERWDREKVRNDQAGDWLLAGDSITVSVVDGLSPQSELAVGIHELVEAFLCRRDGIAEEAIASFDRRFEAERTKGKHSPRAEAGDDERSPYFAQHQMATHVERAATHALGLRWDEHEKTICMD